jgi:hypothetical protein
VRDPQPAALVEVDLEPAVVGGLVMRRAHRGEAARRVIAALAARDDVVHVDEPRVRAAGDAATPAVAPQHGAANPRRDGLGRPRRRVAVDAAQELGVADARASSVALSSMLWPAASTQARAQSAQRVMAIW